MISEIDVLFAATRFLAQRNVIPYQFSIPRGKGIDYRKGLEKINILFSGSNFSPNLVGEGPDIIGLSQNEWWQVECKGAGSGQRSTYRNSFYRALASFVSYYEILRLHLEKIIKK